MSDIVGKDEPLFIVTCGHCKNYLRIIGKLSCKAFDKIPNDILHGDVIHDKVYPGQKGTFIFEQEDK